MPKAGAGTAENTITRNGVTLRYLRIKSGPQRDRYLHQVVAEALIGRALEADEEVHHVDGDTLNNAWWNLQVLNTSEHAKVTNQRTRDKQQGRERARDAQETDGAHGADDAVPF